MGSFTSVSRQKFRTYFQPSRIALAIFQPEGCVPNVITLAFDMYCSYKPNMMAFAVQKNSHTHILQKDARDCVLAIPGESLADFALYCGITSGKDVDKITEGNVSLSRSTHIETPGLDLAIANIELDISERVKTGDHTTLICKVLNFNVNSESRESCLLSVGPQHVGYRVLAQHVSTELR
jgi:flavin reductase (DIM6/NTAB) family NADH-FMN oxidoreductase RutF